MNKVLRFLVGLSIVSALFYAGHYYWSRHHHTNPIATLTGLASAKLPSHTQPLPPEDPNAQFLLVNANESSLDASPALTLNFSLPMDARVDYSGQIDVFQMPSNVASNAQDAANGDASADSAKNEPAGNDQKAHLQASRAVSTAAADIDIKGGKRISGAWVVGDNPRILQFPNILPGKRYVVVVHDNLRSPGGKVLGQKISYSIKVRSMDPAMFFASKGTVLPAHQNGGLPVVTINVPEVDVEFLKVKPEHLSQFLDQVISTSKAVKEHQARHANPFDDEGFFDDAPDNNVEQHLNLNGAVDIYSLNSLQNMSDSVYHGRFLTDPRKNRRNVTFIPVESIKELSEPGIYVAVMNQPGHFDYERQTTFFYVTDLGLSLRQFAKAADVFVNSLKDANAVSGVDVSWLDAKGQVLASSTTDADGHAFFASRPAQARILMAKHDGQMAIIALREPALDLSEYPITGGMYQSSRAFVWSGRDLYRPGETIEVSTLLRDADGQAIAALPVQATLVRADGRNQFVATWRPDPRTPGFFHHRIELPADAPTGMWSLQLRVDPADKIPSGIMNFHVEEFVPEKLKLDLSSNQSILHFGDDFNIHAQGDYLFGAPAANNNYLTDISIEADHNPLADKLPGFYFGDVDAAKVSITSPSESTLDDKGAADVSVHIPSQDVVQTPYTVKATFSLLESGGRPLIRSIQRTIWPAANMVGLRSLSGTVVNSGGAAEFEIVNAAQDGSLKAATGLQMRLIRENRDYFWRFFGQSWTSGFTQTDELVDTRTLHVPAGGRSKLLVNVEYGSYRLELTDPYTHLTTRYRFQAGWDWESSADAAMPRPDRVGLMLDRASYRNGDTAKLTVNSPHHGQAIVTVEGDRVLWNKRVAINQDNQVIDIPVAPEWKRHDLYISVMVLRPGNDGDLVTPTRALGLIPLQIARDDRKLSVNLTAPDKVRPETTVPVKVHVAGLNNRQALVTLSAVDVGILNITQFPTPDPWQFFFGQLGYGADLHDEYGRLIEKMAGQAGELKFGGDAPSHAAKPHSPEKIRLVDLYTGPLQIDAHGDASIMVKLPDFNGKLRLMAVVASADRFGSADREMTVAAPLVAELNTPRFIAFGDRASLALDLHNLSGKAQTLNLSVVGDDALSVSDTTRTVKLGNLDKTTLLFGLTAGASPGVHMLYVKVDGDGIHIKRSFPLQIEAPAPPRQYISYQKIAAGESMDLKPDELKSLYPDTLNGHLLVSDHVPLDVSSVVHDLLVYPYGCVEQTTSTTYPWLFVDENLAKRYNIKPYTMEERAKRVDHSMAKLAALQARNGGFSLWGGEADVEPWLSTYVASFMQDASEQGFTVPDTMYKKSINYLLSDFQTGASSFLSTHSTNANVSNGGWDYSTLHGPDILAFEGFVLARANRAPLSTLRDLYNQRSVMQTPLGKVYLGLALKFMGDSERANRILSEAITTTRAPYRWSWEYGSDLRDYAESYALVTRYKVKLAQADQWLMIIADMLPKRNYYYFDTQEKLSILLAARNETTVSKGGWRADVAVNAHKQMLAGSGDQIVELNADNLASTRVSNHGSGALYITEAISGIPKSAPVTTGNFKIERTLFQPDGTRIDDRPLKVGETVIIHLQIIPLRGLNSTTILVEDQVAAGLEIENLNLVHDSRMGAVQFQNENAEDTMRNPNISHVEYRDDRFAASIRLGSFWWNSASLFYQVRVVTPGHFIMPGTHVEDMYNPQFSDDATASSLTIANENQTAKTIKSEADTPASGQ